MDQEPSGPGRSAPRHLTGSEQERRALLALCLSYDRLLESVVTSRRWKYGGVLGLLAGKLPQPLRRIGLSGARRVAGNRLLRSWVGRAQQDVEYGSLRTQLFSLAFPGPSPTEGRPAAGLAHAEPSVSVVAVLYNGEATIGRFLSALNGQDHDGPIEVVLVDDCSRDAGVATAEAAAEAWGEERRITLTVVRNAANLGNCPSRNAGIRAATGEIIVVIDSDCMVNEGFVSAHVAEHRKGFDIVIGPMGIESRGEDVETLMAALLGSRETVARRMRLQDATALSSAVNCVTRNFSVTRAAVERQDGALFDERFTYRNAPDTGFGWEDVEMGARLCRAGATISFTWDAISVHISHAASVGDRTKAIGSARNFALLMSLHPELYVDSRDWALGTYNRIRAWLTGHGLDPADMLGEVAAVLTPEPPAEPSAGSIVYTAVAGDYDEALPTVPTAGVRYVRFCDAKDGAPGWQHRDFQETDADPVRTAKRPKVLPHLHLRGAAWSVWVDGNVRLLGDARELVAEVAASGLPIGVFRHPERGCAYEEAMECIRRGKDQAGAVLAQMERYRAADYPQRNGLAECNVIVRQHGSTAVAAAMQLWWSEITRGSRRDQLSFNYALWRAGLRYHELGNGKVDVRTDRRFSYLPHKHA